MQEGTTLSLCVCIPFHSLQNPLVFVISLVPCNGPRRETCDCPHFADGEVKSQLVKEVTKQMWGLCPLSSWPGFSVAEEAAENSSQGKIKRNCQAQQSWNNLQRFACTAVSEHYQEWKARSISDIVQGSVIPKLSHVHTLSFALMSTWLYYILWWLFLK